MKLAAFKSILKSLTIKNFTPSNSAEFFCYRNFFNNHEITSVKIFRLENFKMADSKKTSLLQAVGKLKNAKKNSPVNSNDGSKGIKPRNAKGDALKEKIKDAVSKFEGDD